MFKNENRGLQLSSFFTKLFIGFLFLGLFILLLRGIYTAQGRMIPEWKIESEKEAEQVLCEQLGVDKISSYLTYTEDFIKIYLIKDEETYSCVVLIKAKKFPFYTVDTIVRISSFPAHFAQKIYGDDCIVEITETDIKLLWEDSDGIYR